MKLRNKAIQIGAINIKDDFEMANALEEMLAYASTEKGKKEIEEKNKHREYICGVRNPNYVPRDKSKTE